MTFSSGEPKGQPALLALTEMARENVQPPTRAQLDRGLQALSTRMAQERARRSTLLRWSLAGTMATACVVVGLTLLPRLRNGTKTTTAPALTYQIEGGSLIAGGYLRESGGAGIRLSFAEGTEFVLMPGTRGRLRSVDDAGARIAIEQGTASFQITPRSNGRWLVDVGPFLVKVKGTVFTVSWDATNERLDLKLRHGRVMVSGPISAGEIALQAGQRLAVDLQSARTTITDERPEEAWGEAATLPPTTNAPGERPSPEQPPGRTLAGASPSPTAARADGEHHWADALAAGRLDRILAEAERLGFKAVLEKASNEDLLALADAARYRRRMNLARAALLAERRRFPGSPLSLDAAYLLGRVEEVSERSLARAVAWYDEYLSLAPTGTYAAEALGRKMTLTSKLEGRLKARPIAAEYLRRFPNGSYAGSARALSRAP